LKYHIAKYKLNLVLKQQKQRLKKLQIIQTWNKVNHAWTTWWTRPCSSSLLMTQIIQRWTTMAELLSKMTFQNGDVA